jgi:hypothetical protein
MSATAITDEERTHLANIQATNAQEHITQKKINRHIKRFVAIRVGVPLVIVAGAVVVSRVIASKNNETETDETNE